MNGKCRLNGDDLIDVIDLGEQFVSDFVDDPSKGTRCSLRLGIGPTSGLVQIFETHPQEEIYRHYWYRSGINDQMRADLEDIVRSARAMVRLLPGDAVLDIGCNDGTLLSFWEPDLYRVGIDPSNLADEARRHASAVARDFFHRAAYERVCGQPAKVITSIAMFYDLEEPHVFVEDIRSCLHPDGVWVCQLSYTPLMLQQNAFDNIVAEHLEYYTLRVFKDLVESHGLRVVDVELNDVNSGSFRAYVTHRENHRLKIPEFTQMIGQLRVDALLEYEAGRQLSTPAPWREFMGRVERNRDATLSLLRELRAAGKRVLGYGASTKGNTLLQYYDLTPDLIPCIAERSREKWGKYTVGTGIPIVSEEAMREMRPDYLFIFPWHFLQNFLEREHALLAAGTRFIVPLPEVRVVGIEDR